ncbi:MAG: hypothetical protein GXO74_09125 [Calditrichaeota bacterium]|nr:hypothetical protein [Calditrichota bacterium]
MLMKESVPSLGKVLAFLYAEKSAGKTFNSLELPMNVKVEFVRLKEQVKNINTNGIAEQIINEIPEKQCSSAHPFLNNNTEFFLLFFAMEKDQETKRKLCRQLNIHLNNCFRCFSAFSDVLRSYFFEYASLMNREIE